VLASAQPLNPEAEAQLAEEEEEEDAVVADPNDSVAMMKAFLKRQARLEAKRGVDSQLDRSESKRSHHIGDYLPQTEFERFMHKATGRDDDAHKIDETNKGHQLLKKLGWEEGTGLGAKRTGIANPIQATQRDPTAGLGAETEDLTVVKPGDDVYTVYKKRMALSYRFRPNPLNNPRKSYY